MPIFTLPSETSAAWAAVPAMSATAVDKRIPLRMTSPPRDQGRAKKPVQCNCERKRGSVLFGNALARSRLLSSKQRVHGLDSSKTAVDTRARLHQIANRFGSF